ncbi:MAG: outer membrane beta-barrel protein [Bacteroidia bacterium]
MKRSLQSFAIAAFLLLSASSTFAQIGLKFTAFMLPQYVTMRNADDVAAQVKDDNAYKYEPWGGMAAGGYIGYNANETFGLRTGVLFSRQGYQWSSKRNANDRNNYYTRLDYMKIPLMMGLSTRHTGNKTVFSFYAGYQLGFLTNVRCWDDVMEYVPPISDNISAFPRKYNTYNFYNGSIVAETGFDVTLMRELSMNIRFRGDYSLRDAENKSVVYRLTDNGETVNVKYWDGFHGGALRRASHNITAGLLLGVTYNIIPEEYK